MPRSLNDWLLPQASTSAVSVASASVFNSPRSLRPHVGGPGLGTEINNEILFVMRDSRAVVSVRAMRLA